MSEPEIQTSARGERSEDEYLLETGLKVLKVLECLKGRSFEPVSIDRVAQRSGLNRSFVRAALITLKKAGWAKELLAAKERQFVLGPKAENLAKSYSAELLRRRTA